MSPRAAPHILFRLRLRSHPASLTSASLSTLLCHPRQRLRSHPASVTCDLEALREALTHPSALRVHVACDVLSQPDPVLPWIRDFLPRPQVGRYSTAAQGNDPCFG
jgi:hypothetical protein